MGAVQLIKKISKDQLIDELYIKQKKAIQSLFISLKQLKQFLGLVDINNNNNKQKKKKEVGVFKINVKNIICTKTYHENNYDLLRIGKSWSGISQQGGHPVYLGEQGLLSISKFYCLVHEQNKNKELDNLMKQEYNKGVDKILRVAKSLKGVNFNQVQSIYKDFKCIQSLNDLALLNQQTTNLSLSLPSTTKKNKNDENLQNNPLTPQQQIQSDHLEQYFFKKYYQEKWYKVKTSLRMTRVITRYNSEININLKNNNNNQYIYIRSNKHFNQLLKNKLWYSLHFSSVTAPTSIQSFKVNKSQIPYSIKSRYEQKMDDERDVLTNESAISSAISSAESMDE